MNGSWTGWHATRRGKGHTANGIPNQDAIAMRCRGSAFLGIICDGVGSARLSHIGSHALCRVAYRQLRGVALDDGPGFRDSALQPLHALWHAELHCRQEELQHYATTCQIAVYRDNVLTLARIGDGGSLLVYGDGKVCAVDSDHEQDFCNVTAALGPRRQAWQVHRFPGENLKAVYMMTDGIYDDIALREEFATGMYMAYKQLRPAAIRKDFRLVLKHWNVPGNYDDMSLIGFQRI